MMGGPLPMKRIRGASEGLVAGAVHQQQHEQDQARTEHLEGYGYRVLRFTNQEVLDELDSVLERILCAVADLPAAPRVRQRRARSIEVSDLSAP